MHRRRDFISYCDAYTVHTHTKHTHTCTKYLIMLIIFIVYVYLEVFPVVEFSPQDTNATAGDVALLHCNASGFPVPEITWIKNGTAVILDDRITEERVVVMEQLLAVGTLRINRPVLDDNGLYHCNVSNNLKTSEVASANMAQLFVQCKSKLAKFHNFITHYFQFQQILHRYQ